MQKVADLFSRCLNGYYKLSSIICIFVICCMTLMVTSEILMRLLFNQSLQFVMQFSGYSLFIVTFFGVAWVQRQKGHITVDFVYKNTSEQIKALNDIFVSLFSLTICIFLLYLTTTYTHNVWEQGLVTNYPIRFPRVFILIIMPIGWLFFGIEHLVQTFGNIKRFVDMRRLAKSVN